ncbi:MAG: hypothetical protein H6719_28235 [Sandaracinaceae bacterium]|nr:hypothetical protein [Sandaracinaceae bacterium]
MSSAPTPAPHTPMSLIKAGGMDMSAAACAKALAACGIDPDGFGSYKSVNESQRQARDTLGADARKEAEARGGTPDAHVPPCSGGTPCRCHASDIARDISTPEAFLHANAQSGHMSQDAFYRQPSGRFDVCQNHPPGNGHSGTAGYDGRAAPCMDHTGQSNVSGSPHQMICQTEIDFAQGQPNGPMTHAQIEQGVAQSAAVAVTGSRWKYETNPDGSLRMTRENEAKGGDVQRSFSQSQIAAADSGSYAATGAAASTAPATDFNALSDDEKLAIACIVAEFNKGMSKMRSEFEQKYGPGKGAAQKRARAAYAAEHGSCPSWNNMTDAQKAEASAARMRQLEGRPPHPARPSAAGPTAGQSPPGQPTHAECREWQANYLHQQRLNTGGYPPMQPQNNHSSLPPPTTTSGGSSSGVAAD